jgi:predicted permease
MAVGLLGIGDNLPAFIGSTFDTLKVCMGPSAMLLAGVAIAKYSVKNMLTNKKIYIATALRLVILPAVILSALYACMSLMRVAFNMEISNSAIYLAFFAVATPLGLNTVVFPEAYGADPEPGAGMALVSHTLCVVTIPLLFTLVELIFGKFII